MIDRNLVREVQVPREITVDDGSEGQTSSPLPPRPEKLAARIEHIDGRLTVTVHQRSGVGCFLLLWLTGWTVGCVVLAGQVMAKPELGMIAFAVPFWASWLLVASLVVWCFAGQERLRVSGDDVEFVRSALIPISRRTVPLSEVHGFRDCQSRIQENDRHLWGIEVETDGKPIKFGFRLPEQERAWLIGQLNQILRQLQAGDRSKAVLSPTSAIVRGLEADPPAIVGLTLDLAKSLEQPPSDCTWTQGDDFEALEFRQRGRLNVGALCGLLFINAFWNGIVSVFVLVQFGMMPGNNFGPDGLGWWGMMVFLLPFEVIGLLMFVALIITLMEPFRRTWLRFERDRLVIEARWPFFRRRREWPMETLDRLELRRRNPDQSESVSERTPAGDDRTFGLALVTSDNTDLHTIHGLTSGEARWIARSILTERRDWFGR